MDNDPVPGLPASGGAAPRFERVAVMRRVVERLRCLSLRARLLIVTVLLTVVGLFVAGVVTYGALRSFLVDRVDQQIRSSQGAVLDELLAINRGDDRRGRARPGELPQGVVAGLYDADGAPVRFQLGTDANLYDVAGRTGFRSAEIPRSGSFRLLTSRVTLDSARRLRVDPSGPLTAVIGVPLKDVDNTLGRLLMLELFVGLAAVAAIAAAGLWLVRVGLRPLTDIEHTAAAIAAGDLSQRIDTAPSTTEVGRLGGALNTMLGTIEQSFAEREASERRLRQFVADASHELQTPLTSVRGYAELFRRGAADRPEDLANAMSRIEAESKRMGLLVDDLLMLARLDQGRPLERNRVDLVRLASELVGDARIVEPERPITFETDAHLDVVGDEHRLRQVVSNLLSNVRTHTPLAAAVSVRVHRRGDDAVIEVEDDGPGMATEHAQRVFERFFRADASRARVSGGSGLGLSIVAAIVEAHGGRVEVETAPGDGATFRVILPAQPPSGTA